MIQKGFKIIFETNQCLIKDATSNDVFRVKMKGKSFALDPLEEEQIALSATKIHVKVWHKRLRHLNPTTMVNLQIKELVQGLPYLEFEITGCKACQQGKQSRLPLSKHFGELLKSCT